MHRAGLPNFKAEIWDVHNGRHVHVLAMPYACRAGIWKDLQEINWNMEALYNHTWLIADTRSGGKVRYFSSLHLYMMILQLCLFTFLDHESQVKGLAVGVKGLLHSYIS